MRRTYKLTIEMLTALLQGKELHLREGEHEEFVFLPPQGNLVFTREELEEIKTLAYLNGRQHILDKVMEAFKLSRNIKSEVRDDDNHNN